MSERTFAIGDIHGDMEHLTSLMGKLPTLTEQDTLVFLGDYLDRGPDSAEVIRYMMELPEQTPAKCVFLKGNHEDGWLRTIDGSWPQFVLPANNGCLQAMDSFLKRPISELGAAFSIEDFDQLTTGSFFPAEVVTWMEGLAWWYEDKFAIYVHAGLPRNDEGRFLHPSEVAQGHNSALLWLRDRAFFSDYRGKHVIVGHTVTKHLPPELSSFTPEDTEDLWAGKAVAGIDTGCGKGGFLTAIELPTMLVYESR